MEVNMAEAGIGVDIVEISRMIVIEPPLVFYRFVNVVLLFMTG